MTQYADGVAAMGHLAGVFVFLIFMMSLLRWVFAWFGLKA